MTDGPERIELKTKSDAERRLKALRALVPEAFLDGAPDLDLLGQALGISATAGGERYGLSWAGKADAQRALQMGSIATLRPDVEESTSFPDAKHVFVEGDNLEVLRLLQRGYNDRVKMIYIDPPYNTGKDFIYKDDFRHGLAAYLAFSAQVAADGTRLTSNSDTAGRYHSDWLRMMYPRLALARNLLSMDGIILVSINDVEIHNLRHLMDEVFGIENFVATFIWNNEGNIEQQSAVKTNHEYLVAYARNLGDLKPPIAIDPGISEDSKLLKDEIENSITKNGPKNPASTVTLPAGFPASTESFTLDSRSDSSPEVLDPIEVEGGALVSPARLRSGWSSRRLLDLYIANGYEPIADADGKESRFALTPTGAIYGYKRRSDTQSHVLTVLRNMGTTKKQSSLLQQRAGLSFSFPKPEMLLEYLVTAFTGDGDLVMDFFAGSGTTAAAVLRANTKDQGRRRFLLVQLDEPVTQTEALEAGFKTISEMTVRRVRAALEDHAPSEGLRVLRLGGSCFKVWDPETAPQEEKALAEHLTLYSDSLSEDADDDAITVEIMLREGIPLDTSVTRVEIAGTPADLVGDDLAICLARSATTDLIDGVIESGVPRVVLLETAFAGEDDLKSNSYYRLRDAAIEMRTV